MSPGDVIKPLKPGLKKWTIGTFDIETRGENGETALLGNFVLGATCEDEQGTTVQFHTSMLSIISVILARQDKVRWFVHNGGNFDLKYIINNSEVIDFIFERGYSIEVIGGKIAKGLILRKGKKSIIICDSYKLMQSKLSDLAKKFGVETLKGFIDFDKEDFDENKQEHLDYLADDVKSLHQVVTKYRSIIGTEFLTDIKCTASSTAFACWQTGLHKNVYKQNKLVNAFVRKAYFGGRTECFYQGTKTNITYIDVNSLYAFIMREYGALHRPFFTTSLDGPGFYRVNAFVPDGLKFGPLPYRNDKGGLSFPTGIFETYCSSLEIEIALEMGCTIEVIEGVAYEEHDKDLFKPFIEKCMNIRSRDYHGALGQAAKFLQNNLYGFFGMNPERDELILSKTAPETEGFEPVIDESTGEHINHLWSKITTQDTINCIPAFAAWITSAARVHLLRAMLLEEQAGNKVLYCDTDSIFVAGTPVSYINDGEYGAFKIEYVFDRLTLVTSKTYSGNVGEKVTNRCKGIPAKKLEAEFIERAALGFATKITFPQLNSLSVVAKTGILGRADYTRAMPTVASITARKRGKNGWTIPLKIGETA